MSPAWFLIAVPSLGLLYLWYAAIVARRNRVGEALGAIDAQLTQRHDLVPNLLAVAKRFMAHEHDLLSDITMLRGRGQQTVGAPPTDSAALGAKFTVEERLGADMRRLLAIAEDYPDLKAQGPLIEAQQGLAEVETNIAAARRFYNSAVGDLRNACQIFPGPLLARLAGVRALPPFYESRPDERAAVDAGRLL